MYDTIDLVLDAYEQIGPGARRADRCIEWLRRDVAPLVHDLIARPDFRETIRGSLERLRVGAASEERRLVQSVEAAFVGHAAALAAFGRRWAPRSSVPDRGLRDRRNGTAYTWDGAVSCAQFIAEKPWEALFSEADIYQPTAGLNLKPSAQDGLRPQEFVPGLHAELRQPGNHVSGMLLRRVRYWCATLSDLRNALRPDADELARQDVLWTDVRQTATRLSDAAKELEALLVSGPHAAISGACVALAQVYADFHAVPDFARLAGFAPSWSGYYSYWLRNHGETLVASRVAAALAEVAPMCRRTPGVEGVLTEAARTHELVLACGLGARYIVWKQRNVDFPARLEKPWETFWQLAIAAAAGQAVDPRDFGSCVTARNLVNWIHRLCAVLPEDLAERIRSPRRREDRGPAGTYRLRIPADQVYLAHISEDGVVDVTRAGTPSDVRRLLADAGL